MLKPVKPNTDSIDDALFFNKQDVARVMKVCDKTVTNLVKRGSIPQPVYFGRLPRWSKQKFLDWIEAGSPAISA
jgi:hypothetical protein